MGRTMDSGYLLSRLSRWLRRLYNDSLLGYNVASGRTCTCKMFPLRCYHSRLWVRLIRFSLCKLWVHETISTFVGYGVWEVVPFPFEPRGRLDLTSLSFWLSVISNNSESLIHAATGQNTCVDYIVWLTVEKESNRTKSDPFSCITVTDSRSDHLKLARPQPWASLSYPQSTHISNAMNR